MKGWHSALFCAALALAGCGFKPLYGPESAAAGNSAFSRIQVASIPDRVGQTLYRDLSATLTGSAGADYELQVNLRQEFLGFGLRGDDIVTGAPGDASAQQEQQTLYADARLVHLATGEAIWTRTLRAESAYDLVQSDFAINSQREDTARRLALQLSERLERQLAAYFATHDTSGL